MKSITNTLLLICLIAGSIFINACEKDNENGNTVTDINGNVYKTVKIGSQEWMAENLRATSFIDNTAIPEISGPVEWENMATSAYCWYNNQKGYKDTLGAIYNWYAVNTGKLCPTGWHVPTDSDFITLETYLGLPKEQVHVWGWRGSDQGSQMKSTSGWIGGKNFATNSSDFSAISGGYRQKKSGMFSGYGTITIFWTSTDDSFNGKPNEAWYRRLDANEIRIFKGSTLKAGGSYVRCVRN